MPIAARRILCARPVGGLAGPERWHLDIYAQNLSSNDAPVIPVTHGSLSQINPRTDGRYVVWQGREINGNWDVFVKDLTVTNGPQALTSTPILDEVNSRELIGRGGLSGSFDHPHQ